MGRDVRLIMLGEPCDLNFFGDALMTMEEARSRMPEMCPNYYVCNQEQIYCALRMGMAVAREVIRGGNLDSELLQIPTDKPYFDSKDGESFIQVQNRGDKVRAVERFARKILQMDEEKSVFGICSACDGPRISKTVVDSGRDGVTPFSGSGVTRTRDVEYCLNCDSEPRGGTFREEFYIGE